MQGDLTTTLAAAGIDAATIDLHHSGFQRTPTEDKPHSKNGAVIVLSTQPLRIWYQNWAAGITGLYAEGGGRGLPSPAEYQRIKRARQQARIERETTQAEIAARAEALWRSAKRADPSHPYLVRKQIRPHSLRQIDDNLIVPVRLNCALQSLQFISPAGDKMFLRGGRVAGCNASIGIPANTLLVAEGYATAATLHEVLGLGCAIAFSSGNLKPVATELKRRYPQSRIIICADNDAHTAGNPGLKHAIEAAAAVGGWYIAPTFSMKAAATDTDWNDYFIRYGAAALRACFTEVRVHVG